MLKDIIRYFFGGYQKRKLIQKREILHQKRDMRKYLEGKIMHIDKNMEELDTLSPRDLSDDNLARIASIVYNNYPGQSHQHYQEFKKAKDNPKYIEGLDLKEEMGIILDTGKLALKQKKEQYQEDVKRLERHKKVPMYLLERIAQEQNYHNMLQYQRGLAAIVMTISFIIGILSISPIINGNVIGISNRYGLIGVTSIILFIIGLLYYVTLKNKIAKSYNLK